MNFEVGEIIVNIRSKKLYKVTNVHASTIDCRRVKHNQLARHGSNWNKNKFRKLTKLDKALQ